MPNMNSIISNHNRNILNTQYDISNQPYIPNSTLSTESTPPNQSIPTAPTQVLPEHNLNKIMQSLKRNVTAERKIVVL